ncbi:hypothetical protein Leryth_022309 [Lithospermum erythrorhizon]|nr:hypothetical protein Leryth_022309 [Lithospermum erythrorhizon]
MSAALAVLDVHIHSLGGYGTWTHGWSFELWLVGLGGLSNALETGLETFNGLCSWHITENAKKNLDFYADSKFLSEPDFLINEIDTLDEINFN